MQLSKYNGRQGVGEFREATLTDIIGPSGQWWTLTDTGSAYRCRPNGAVKRWKSEPSRFSLPMKIGWRGCFTVTRASELLLEVPEVPALPRKRIHKAAQVAHLFAVHWQNPALDIRSPAYNGRSDLGYGPFPRGNASACERSFSSYRTEIARVIEAPENRGNVVCILRNSWGPVTRGHISDVVSAFHNRLLVFEDCYCFDDHERNLLQWRVDFNNAMDSAKSATRYGYTHLARAQAIVQRCLDYCGIFGLPMPKLTIPAALVCRVAEQRAAQQATQREAMIREQRERADTLTVIGNIVRSSQGAEVPIDHVKRALPIVQRILASGESWQSNGKTIPLGHFKLDRIADGKVIAGCHEFSAQEVAHLSAQLYPLA